jgi:hypothetical protein
MDKIPEDWVQSNFWFLITTLLAIIGTVCSDLFTVSEYRNAFPIDEIILESRYSIKVMALFNKY